jgi:hypothetical protein
MRKYRFSVAVILLTCAATGELFGTDPATARSPEGSTELAASAFVGHKHAFLKTPKIPFPYYLERQVWGTRTMQYNAIIRITVDHGKITAVPSGGYPALAKHLAWSVQKYWVADPGLSGVFTFPMKFEMRLPPADR